MAEGGASLDPSNVYLRLAAISLGSGLTPLQFFWNIWSSVRVSFGTVQHPADFAGWAVADEGGLTGLTMGGTVRAAAWGVEAFRGGS